MRFWIRESNGRVHDGINILGAGGIIRNAARVEGLIRFVTEGHALGYVYEPKPGHVLGYYEKWWGRGEEREVDLRGAELLRWSTEPLPDLPPPPDYFAASVE